MYDFPWYKMLVHDYSNTDPLCYAELYKPTVLVVPVAAGPVEALRVGVWAHCSAVSVTAVLSHIPQWQSGLHLTQ